MVSFIQARKWAKEGAKVKCNIMYDREYLYYNNGFRWSNVNGLAYFSFEQMDSNKWEKVINGI